jgi:hypothetical protein
MEENKGISQPIYPVFRSVFKPRMSKEVKKQE